MRPLGAIIALLLMAGLMPSVSYADGMPPAAVAVKARAVKAEPSCPCPPVRHVRHFRYRHHHYVRHWRRARRLAPLMVAAPLPYNAPIPWPWDTAYDRGMTLHFRSAAVSGTWTGEPGFPPTPPIVPVEWYREPAAGGAVYQYDGLTGEYVRLAAIDAARAFPPAPPRPPAPPPAPR